MTVPRTPPPPGPPPGPSGPTGFARLLDQLGWRGERRAAPFLSHALGAGGGALLAVGVLVLGFDLGDDNGSMMPGGLFMAVLVAAAIVLMFRLPGPGRSGCVAALVVAVPSLWFFLTAVESSSGSITALQLLTCASFVALFLLPPTRGRAVLLALALLFLWTFVVGEIAGTNKLSEIETQSSSEEIIVSPDGDFEDFDEDDETFPESSAQTDAGIVSLVFGAGYLVAAWAFDRRQLLGLGTPFVAVGILAAATGAIIVGVDAGAIGGGLLAVGVGLGVGFVGARGRDRRASVWLGALTAVIGITVVIADIFDIEDSASAFATLAMLVGAGIVVGAVFLSRFLDEPDDEQPDRPLPGQGAPAS
jgi:hypothetical protein